VSAFCATAGPSARRSIDSSISTSGPRGSRRRPTLAGTRTPCSCDDGLLFGYFETPDSLPAAYARMAANEVNADWQECLATRFRVARSPPPGCAVRRVDRDLPPRLKRKPTMSQPSQTRLIENAYALARERYAALGVDTD
jgi:hypothetical protein